MITLKKTKDPENEFDHADIEFTVKSVRTDEIVQEFYYFMLGIGHAEGSILMAMSGIIEENEP